MRFSLSSGSPTHGWRNLIGVLMLALTIGGVGPTPPAQAAPASANVRYFLEVAEPVKTTICVGETVEYRVTLQVEYAYGSDGEKGEFAVSGAKIEAGPRDNTIGTFKRGSAIAGFADEDLVTASLFFTAKKPGKTILDFETLGNKQDRNTYVSFPVPIKVIQCKYRVSVISNWFVAQGTGGSISLVSLVRWAELTAVSEDNFMGTGTARWVPTVVLPPACTHSDKVSDSTVTITGGLNTEEKLVLTIIFGPTALAEVGGCGPQPIDNTYAMHPDSLAFVEVPATGGTWQGKQLLLDTPSGKILGQVTVIVVPVEK